MREKMLSDSEIEKYQQTVERYNKAVAEETAMQSQLQMVKQQAMEILKKYGYKKMSNLGDLQAKLYDMEADIKKSEQEMLTYIQQVNEKKAEKDRILLG